jgi:hypothetical protein
MGVLNGRHRVSTLEVLEKVRTEEAKMKERKSKGKRPVTTEVAELGENLNVDVEDM